MQVRRLQLRAMTPKFFRTAAALASRLLFRHLPPEMNEPVPAASFTRALRLKVKAEAYPWLAAAAVEVNQSPPLAARAVAEAAHGRFPLL